MHTLDRDATPEQKAAQARKGAPDLSGAKPGSSGATEVVSDVGNKATVKPTTTLKDLEKTQLAEDKSIEVPTGDAAVTKAKQDEGREDQDGTPSPPGSMPTANVAREIPSWFQIGWTGQDKTFFMNSEEAQQHKLLAQFVDEAYFGSW